MNTKCFLSYCLAFCSLLVGGLFTEQSAHAGSCAQPNLLIIVDNSCSMGSNSKWTQAASAIKTITNTYNSKLTFGLEVFSSGASVVYGINKCQSDGSKCVPNLQNILKKYGPSGGTNLIAAINTAKSHISGLSATLRSRKTSVMFLTDGQSSCANAQVKSLRAALKVDTFVIGFGSGVTVSCLNSMATEGGTALAGSRKYYQANSQSELNKAMKAIANAASQEVCNNNDDDCDGLIDEGLSRGCSGPCGQGTQTCKAGKWQTCSTARQPKAEICNNIDDDCDGTIDERLTRSCKTACGNGVETCSKGKWVNCNAPKSAPEVCNNKDEDCDGVPDNGLTRTCKTVCGNGKETCVAGAWKFCSAQKAKTETCNNVDDNCDGTIDEGLERSCTSACGPGTEKCKAGKWVDCTGRKPEKEICDGRDNNCDGQVDEKLFKACQSKCGAGQEICNNGSWEKCNAPTPKKEVCNGLDDDCNGQNDDVTKGDPKCPRCVKGVCLRGCTQECPKGFTCEDSACVEIPCRRVRCGNTETCKNGKCVDICSGITCPNGQKCVNAQCVDTTGKDCTTLGCPNGQKCTNKQCVSDPCSKVTCEGREFCRDGKCVGSCANITCDKHSRCEDGKCVSSKEPCATITCQKEQICKDGKCIGLDKHPCAGKQCQKEQYCDPKTGQCLDDPCKAITCPGGNVCHRGQCYGGTNPPPKEPKFPTKPGKNDENPSNAENPITNDEQPIAPKPDGAITKTNREDVYTDGGNKNGTQEGKVRYPPVGCPCSIEGDGTNPGAPLSLLFLFLAGAISMRRRKS